ncbi:MAG: TonB-dependent receptor, partial [Bacteroidota bacterium]
MTSLSFQAFSQTPVQTIRGIVTDADNGRPLAGANILLPDFQVTTGTTTDTSGNYRLENIPVGRYRLQVSYVGFETVVVAEVLVEAGKEVVQDVQLHERREALQEVVVKAAGSGGATAHPLSVHTLTVEEQFRFPATFNDPARLAMSFPGVVGTDDQGNSISVRGNSPAAVKWHLEGVEIVNPNHTANAGTFSDRPTQAGGGVNILSAQLLGASQFLTGAFPAEYGNALGGILDMRLRKGNDQRHEFTAQAGFLGLEAAAEGPFSKKSSASYLVNYRYSFTGLLTAMGVDFGDESISFQDLSFNLVFPTKKAGQFTLFGMGGRSENDFQHPEDTALIDEEKDLYDINFSSEMRAAGFTHVLPLGKKSVWRTASAISHLNHLRRQNLSDIIVEWDELEETKLSFSSIFFHKINAAQRLKAGIFLTWENDWGGFDGNINARSWLWQPFVEWSARLFPKLDFTAGLHGTWFTFNRTGSAEPRLALQFSPNARRRFSFSASLHSQLQPYPLYLASNLAGDTPNRNLGLSKAAHFVASWRQILGKSLIFNTEVYFQRLLDVPVSSDPGNSFSTLNLTEIFRRTDWQQVEKLTNKGIAKNYGIDLSLQKFILDRYYFLLAASAFRSKYTPADGIERPTRFDNRYVFNLTGGREFSKTKGEKVRVKGINARFVWLGGNPATPIDIEA